MNGLGGVSSASTGSHPKRVLKHQKLNLNFFLFLPWLVYYITRAACSFGMYVCIVLTQYFFFFFLHLGYRGFKISFEYIWESIWVIRGYKIPLVVEPSRKWTSSGQKPQLR